MLQTNSPVHSVPNELSHRLADLLARSIIFRRGRRLFEENAKDWNMPLSKLGKLEVGAYLILRDYSRGHFPPRFDDRARAYQGEIDYTHTLPGITPEAVNVAGMRKPFWFGAAMDTYLREFSTLSQAFLRCGITPPARVLELGCGHGWTSEFLAAAGFEVTGTSIVEEDVVWARKRIASLQAKGLSPVLNFEVSPMEEVAERVGPKGSYDVVFVFEALHHAFDWRETIAAASECLKVGGWLLVCHEPNLLHTFISYRVAHLSNTHEIGMSRPELIQQMRHCGLSRVVNLGPHWHFWIKSHFLCAQKVA